MRALLAVALAMLGFQDSGPWRIVFQTAREREFFQTKSAKADGTDVRDETEDPPLLFGRSPDGKRRVITLAYATSTRIAVCALDGSQETPITDGTSKDHMPSWSPDGRIVFESSRSGKPQIWIMDADGKNPKKLTDHRDGAGNPSVSADGRIAYVELHESREKLPPSTLRTMDLTDRESKVLIEKTQMQGHSWSPKGDRIACSLVQELRILEMPSGKPVKSFNFGDIHKELYAHAAYGMIWRPDGAAIACTINFLGGRMEGAQDFGDNKIFVLPFEGKPGIIDPGGIAIPRGWTK